jgi:hypothetical protein
MTRARIALLSGSPIEWSPLMADYDPPEPLSLVELWPQLGLDERLSILLEQQTAELRRLVALASQMEPYAAGRVAGYASAVGDIMAYAIEGTPPENEVSSFLILQPAAGTPCQRK